MRVSIPSPLMQPSPNGRRVGIRIVTFEACSGFTHITVRRIAQPPEATFVTRLQPGRLPNRAARQLPDLSTTIRVEPSSTGDPRLRGALPSPDIGVASKLAFLETDEGKICRGHWGNDASDKFGRLVARADSIVGQLDDVEYAAAIRWLNDLSVSSTISVYLELAR